MFAACDKNDKNISEAVNEQAAFENLLADIDALNSTFQFDINPTNSTDGPMALPKWLGIVAGVDATGAAVGSLLGPWGALGGGIFASLLSIPYLPENYAVSYNSEIPTYEILDNEIGALHNEIIGEILTNYPTILIGSFTEDELISIVCNKLNEHNIVLSTESLKDIYNERAKALVETIVTTGNISEAMDEAIVIYPEYKSEFQVIKSYSSGVGNIRTTETLLDYTNQVATIVSKASIPVSSQNQITSFVAVYTNSRELWGE